MDISSIALQGLQQADDKLQQAATRLAGIGGDAASSDTVEISAEMVALLAAKNEYSVNIRTLKAGDEVQKTALDILA